MKNIKYLSLFFVGMLVAACGDPELRFEPFDEAAKGAFARNLSLTGSFVFTDPAGSSFDGRVEFYDENNGKNVASYSWTVEFRANNGGNGGVDIAPVTFLTIPSSSFTTNADGLPEVSFSLNMQAAMDALGLTIADFSGGDQFRFDATVTKTDGSSFGPGNTGPNVVSQPPFRAMTRVNANVVCLSDIGGTYNYTTTGTSTDGCCPNVTNVTGTATLTDKGGGVYDHSDFSGGLYVDWYTIYGINPASFNHIGAEVLDVCQVFTSDFTEIFGSAATIRGTIDNATGVITYTWTNGFGDTGDVVMTPQ